jgi:hypothetical protein
VTAGLVGVTHDQPMQNRGVGEPKAHRHLSSGAGFDG